MPNALAECPTALTLEVQRAFPANVEILRTKTSYMQVEQVELEMRPPADHRPLASHQTRIAGSEGKIQGS